MNESNAEQYKQEDTEYAALEWFKRARKGFDQALLEGNNELARDIIQDAVGIGFEEESKVMMKELADAVQLESDRQIYEDKAE